MYKKLAELYSGICAIWVDSYDTPKYMWIQVEASHESNAVDRCTYLKAYLAVREMFPSISNLSVDTKACEISQYFKVFERK